MTPNGPVPVACGLVVWLLTYLWFLQMGVDVISLVIRLLLGLIPALGMAACVYVGIREWGHSGPWPWAVPAIVLAVVLVALMVVGGSPVHEYTAELRKVGARLTGGKAGTAGLGAILAQLLLALLVGLVFASIGAAGAWGGYKLAYGSRIVGAFFGTGVVVGYVLEKVAFTRARWNLVHRGGDVLERLRQAAASETRGEV